MVSLGYNGLRKEWIVESFGVAAIFGTLVYTFRVKTKAKLLNGFKVTMV